jgi:hypothetical protein
VFGGGGPAIRAASTHAAARATPAAAASSAVRTPVLSAEPKPQAEAVAGGSKNRSSANNEVMFTGILNANRAIGVATLIVAAAVGLAGVAHADPDGQMYGNPEAAAGY